MLREITKSLDKYLIISNLPIFEDLKAAEKVFVTNRAQIIECGKQSVIYNEGDDDKALYVMLTGKVHLYHTKERSRDDKEELMETLRKGDCFGIVSLLTGRPHSATAKVVSDARMIKIDQISFNEIINKVPALGVYFSKHLSRRLNENYTKRKAVFENHIVAVYYEEDEAYGSFYARTLAEGIANESGKKVLLAGINKSRYGEAGSVEEKILAVSAVSKLESAQAELCNEYDFVVFDLPRELGAVEKHILKEADYAHIIFGSEKHFLDTATALLGKVGGKHREGIKILLKEDGDISKTTAKTKHASFTSGAYATLPEMRDEFKRTVRRIARETAGVRVGLALGAGGALGLSEIGILEVFEEEKIAIDIIAGTSMGALIAALWASGYPAEEVTKIMSTFETKSSAFGLMDFTMPKKGLIGGDKVRKFLAKYLGTKTFQDVKLPLRLVACDINRREEVVISSGKLVDAVMASIAIPGVFNPVTLNDKILVDGGIVTPVPVGVLSRENVKRIIAVNAMPSPEDVMKSSAKDQSIIDIVVNSMYSMEYKIGKLACQEADVYLHPTLKNADWYEFYRAKEFVKCGKEEARKALPEIRKLIKG